MTDLETIRPSQWQRVMDLVADAGIDVTDWSKDFTRDPSTNPKFCYNWAFEKPGEFVVVCLWHSELRHSDASVIFAGSLRQPVRGKGAANWKRRAQSFGEHIRKAYRNALPVRAILLAGKRRNDDDPDPESSAVEARLLDAAEWAVTAYDFASDEFVITRGIPPNRPGELDDPEVAAFEGEPRRLFVIHRRREFELRNKKIQAALIENNGSLICEVPRCNFDFKARYGSLGEGFAHVHHKKPLAAAPAEGVKTSLKDLAVVCANCHAMIHRGGKCREIDDLIVS
jgi:5-methylcytosine-specific restriction protein A